MPETIAVLTTIWGVVMALAPLLQIRVILKNRDSSGISVSWLFIMLIGFGLWLTYGLVYAQTPIIIANIVAFLVALALLIVVAIFRRRYSPAKSAKIDQNTD